MGPDTPIPSWFNSLSNYLGESGWLIAVLVILIFIAMGGSFLVLIGYTVGYQFLSLIKSKWFWILLIIGMFALFYFF